MNRHSAASPTTYDEAIKRVWRPLDPAGSFHEVVRAGTLAANSHNTQPWRFALSGRSIAIAPDYARRCPAVDPDDHHLFASIGCAVENMVQAAPHIGFAADVRLDNPERATLDLVPMQARTSAISAAIASRQCTRAEYDGRILDAEEVKSLATAGSLDGVACEIVTDRNRIEAILEYVLQGTTAQLRDKTFMQELVRWVRFNDRETLAHLDGLATRCTGRPSLPEWIGRRLMPLDMTERRENDRYAKQVRSSAGIAIFAASSHDRSGWIAAGRAYQRFALQATVLGVRNALINQPVEVSTLRSQFASYLGLGTRRPDLVVRFGRGPLMPQSLRRPVEAVVETERAAARNPADSSED